MPNAPRDENRVPVALGTLYSDGATVVPLAVNPITHRISFDRSTTATDLGPTNALRDENRVPTWIGVSSDDGVTPVPAYFTAEGKPMIDAS